ncbi:MAG: alpha/beta fold hydrolase [Candidatus Sumerlaeaceae bacterium]
MQKHVFKGDMLDTVWGKMYVRSAGDGEPVVLVHGLGVSGTYFLRSAELLARDFAVLIPDLPGSGRSAKPRHVLNVAQLADVLAEWITQAGLQPVHWIGNSFGCQVVIELGVRYPHLLRSATLLGPTIEAQARSAMRQLFRLALDASREPFSEIGIALMDYLRFGPRRFWRTFVHAREDRIEEKLWQFKVPTLVMHGGRDPIVPQHWAELVTGLLPDARLVTIPEAAHTVHYSHPEEFTRTVSDFIRTCRGLAQKP